MVTCLTKRCDFLSFARSKTQRCYNQLLLAYLLRKTIVIVNPPTITNKEKSWGPSATRNCVHMTWYVSCDSCGPTNLWKGSELMYIAGVGCGVWAVVKHTWSTSWKATKLAALRGKDERKCWQMRTVHTLLALVWAESLSNVQNPHQCGTFAHDFGRIFINLEDGSM